MDRPRTVMAPVDSQKTVFDAGVKRAVDSRSAGKNVMKPQTFDGKESVNSFLAHFEVCANFNQIKSNQIKLFYLSLIHI